MQIKLSLKGEAMTMRRRAFGAVSSSRRHGEECLELRVEGAECLKMALISRCHAFKGGKDGEQASSILWELMGLGAFQGHNTVREIVVDSIAEEGPFISPDEITRACETKDIKTKHRFGIGQGVPLVGLPRGKLKLICPESS